MGCDACLGGVPGATVWDKGVITTPTGDEADLVDTATGGALFYAAEAALDKYWVLQPQGSETSSALRERIAVIFTQRVMSNWTGPISAETVNASPAFDAVVADVSLTSRRKGQQEIAASRTKKIIYWGIAALAVGVLAMFYFRGRSS
jgi:hypothetical protein